MGMNDANIGSLKIKVVFRINHPISAPANSQERMVLNHGKRTLPKSQPHLRRSVHLGKYRCQPLIKHRICQQQHAAYHSTGCQYPQILHHAVQDKNRHNNQQCPTGISHCQAGCCRQHEGSQHDAFGFAVRFDKEAKRETDHDIQITSQDIRILPRGKDPLAKFWKGISIHPLHRTDVDAENVLIKTVKDDQYSRSS